MRETRASGYHSSTAQQAEHNEARRNSGTTAESPETGRSDPDAMKGTRRGSTDPAGEAKDADHPSGVETK